VSRRAEIEAVMDYAACNVVYVDRAAREDKLVKKDHAIPADSSIDAPKHAIENLPSPWGGSPVDTNLRTLLGTFNEGICSSTYGIVGRELTPNSTRLHVRDILHLQTLRTESHLDTRSNTYHCSYRYPI